MIASRGQTRPLSGAMAEGGAALMIDFDRDLQRLTEMLKSFERMILKTVHFELGVIGRL